MSVEVPIDLLKDLVGELKKVPMIDSGVEYFPRAGEMVVRFNIEFEKPPSVTARFEAPEGWPIEKYPFTPPDVIVSEVEVKAMEAINEFKEIVKEWKPPLKDGLAYPEWLAEELGRKAEAYLKSEYFKTTILGALVDLTDMRDAIIDAVKAFGRTIGNLIDWLLWEFVRAYLEDIWAHIKGQVDAIMEDVRSKINKALGGFRDKVQEAFNTFRGGLQANVDEITSYTNDALNLSFDRFYESLGLSKKYLCIPAMIIRGSVTNTQFKVWSPGAVTLHWHAIGSPSMIGQPVLMQLETLIEKKT